jgi:hypothetical protein
MYGKSEEAFRALERGEYDGIAYDVASVAAGYPVAADAEAWVKAMKQARREIDRARNKRLRRGLLAEAINLFGTMAVGAALAVNMIVGYAGASAIMALQRPCTAENIGSINCTWTDEHGKRYTSVTLPFGHVSVYWND